MSRKKLSQRAMMPEFPEGAITSMEPVSAEQLKKEGWGRPEGTRDNWGDGPWRDEPDRVEWVEPETGYRCEIRRNHAGSLCGYVTVPDDHIWHGIEYSGCINKHAPLTRDARLAELRETVAAAERLCEAEPEAAQHLSALRLAKLHLEATETEGSFMWDYEQYPCLDYSREDRCPSPESLLRVHGGVTYSGTPKGEEGWRYGFDTAHSGDYSPGMEAMSRWLDTTSPSGPNPYRDPHAIFDPITGIKHEHGMDEVYRDMSYVKQQTESLAKQLWAIHKVGV